MPLAADQLDPICRIPQRLARRSVRDLVMQTGYREIRPLLNRADIADHLARHPGLVFDWLRYSESRRTPGAWHLMHPSTGWVVGRPAGAEEERELRFGSGPEACAEFILRELDSVAGDPVGTPRPE